MSGHDWFRIHEEDGKVSLTFRTELFVSSREEAKSVGDQLNGKPLRWMEFENSEDRVWLTGFDDDRA